jgi:hypothetical protein
MRPIALADWGLPPFMPFLLSPEVLRNLGEDDAHNQNHADPQCR